MISLFYYFRVAKVMFLVAPEERVPSAQPYLGGFLALLGAVTVVTGLYNAPLKSWADDGPSSLGIPTEPAD